MASAGLRSAFLPAIVSQSLDRFSGIHALGNRRQYYRRHFCQNGRPMLIALLTSCTISQPIDRGQPAPCDGVLISAERAKQAVADKREVELRKTFECAPCPSCPEPKKDETVAIATASFFAGFVLGLTLFLVR